MKWNANEVAWALSFFYLKRFYSVFFFAVPGKTCRKIYIMFQYMADQSLCNVSSKFSKMGQLDEEILAKSFISINQINGLFQNSNSCLTRLANLLDRLRAIIDCKKVMSIIKHFQKIMESICSQMASKNWMLHPCNIKFLKNMDNSTIFGGTSIFSITENIIRNNVISA